MSYKLTTQQEVAGEEGGPRAGDQLPERPHPAGRILVAQVRTEAHQGLALPAVIKQLQHPPNRNPTTYGHHSLFIPCTFLAAYDL
jgi:hypothetical protein